MDLKLLELRRYAIDNRVQIKFGDPQHVCVINDKGKINIVNEEKDFRVEDVFAAADRFEIIEGGKTLQLTREAAAETVSEGFKKRGFATSVKEEE